jgi:hypothetical protein
METNVVKEPRRPWGERPPYFVKMNKYKNTNKTDGTRITLRNRESCPAYRVHLNPLIIAGKSKRENP